MLPFYKDGDFVIVTRVFLKVFLKKNRDVVFMHNDMGLLIKRIKSLNHNKKVIKVFGTGDESVTSKKIGEVRFENIEGIVLLKI